MINREVYFKNPEPTETLPDEVPEGFYHSKSELKSKYSIPHTFRSLEELQAIHQSGWIDNDQFVYEELDAKNRVVRVLFNEKGQVSERITYKENTDLINSNRDPNSILKKTTYLYDDYDYLETIIDLNSSDLDTKSIHSTQIGKSAGQVIQILYGTNNVDWKPKKGAIQNVKIRVPDYILIREVLTNTSDPTLSIPGHPWAFSKAQHLDLTNIPYEQPINISEPPTFPLPSN